MPHAYTEDQLVEQPAIGLFDKLGWQTVSAMEEVFGDAEPSPQPSPKGRGGKAESAALGRETPGEVVLLPRLQTALERLNPRLPPEAVSSAIEEITRNRAAMLPAAANREVYQLLKEGIRVSVADTEPSPQPSPTGRGSGSSTPHHEHGRAELPLRPNVAGGAATPPYQMGGQTTVRVQVIDWEHPEENDFLLVSQMTIVGPLYTCRPDLIGFVNGLPLVVIELKKPGVPAKQAFDENLTSYKHAQNGIPALFWYNALLIASNGTDSRVGTVTAGWERFVEWKRIEREDEPRHVSLETVIRGTCDKGRLLDLIENFTLFSEHRAGLIKVLAQNHQFLGVNNAIAASMEARAKGHGRGGVFWQTQGSGKSFSMVFYAQKILRRVPGNWTFVVVTDRVELDDQIAKTFAATGAVSDADQSHAASGEHLRELLRGNQRYVFTLIHKFQPEKVRAETPSSPALLPAGEGGESPQYRGGLEYAGLVERARELRKHHTPAEEVAWELLRDRRFEGLKFRREHQINNYIADYFCAEHQIDIELDGEIHKSPEVMAKDATRDAMLSSLGFKVLRFQNQVVLEQPEEFLRQIAVVLELPSTSGRGAGGEGHGQMPVLCDRPDVIVLTDEAHRSQYDTLAMNMRAALPNATFVAFTGTPLIASEERTKEVFGDYVSIYDFQQSVEDGATVPLFYENRTPELEIVNPDLNEDIYALIEEAELSEEAEKKLQRELGKQYQIITRDDRLEKVAADIVSHFLGRGFRGKAMVVSIDKATALRMYDKVQTHWKVEQARLQKALGGYDAPDEQERETKERLDFLNRTDMAVIVSPGQNEIEQMKKLDLDIVPHRERMNREALDEKFKDPDDPLNLVFVCAMWLTGFDAPSCSTLYLDKPMRNHTLMQTIARANRVYPGKHSGVIVDYANVFASLEKALAIYGAGKGGKTPVRDKQKLVEELRKAIEGVTLFCANRGVMLPAIEQLPSGDLRRLERIADAVEALISPDGVRKDFLAQQKFARTLFDAIKPDPTVLEFLDRIASLTAIADAIRGQTTPGNTDISTVMEKVGVVLDAAITGVEMPTKPAPVLDLSKIDFEALRHRFKESKRRNTDLEALKAAIRAQLEKLIQLNKTRVDFLDRFEDLIESYNSGSRTIEELFEELLNLSRNLNEEQQRHVRENLREEELVIFDILTRPAPELGPAERDEVKKIARALLERLKALLVISWREKSSARSQVKLTIEDTLDDGLPRAYSPELYQQKCSQVFNHFYESYQGEGQSAYEAA